MSQSKIRRYMKHGLFPQLAVFEAIARLGGFTRAAEELCLAQPTVSVQIKKLTESVGLPLFEVVGKRVHLTEAGRELYSACREIFGSMSKLEDTLSDIRGLKAGRLNLAVSTSACYFAPRLLAAYARKYPGIEISVQIHNRRTLLDRLAVNADDLFIFAELPENPDCHVQSIASNPMEVIAAAGHALAGEKNISFERFAREPFLIREPGSGTRMLVQRIFDQHGIEPLIRMELSTDEAIKQAILAGLGVSVLSRYLLDAEGDRARLVALDVDGFPLLRHWYFVHPAGKQLPPVARAFMDFARAGIERLVPDPVAPAGIAPQLENSVHS